MTKRISARHPAGWLIVCLAIVVGLPLVAQVQSEATVIDVTGMSFAAYAD